MLERSRKGGEGDRGSPQEKEHSRASELSASPKGYNHHLYYFPQNPLGGAIALGSIADTQS